MVDLGLLESKKVRPILRREYERLVEDGMFANERLELLHGLLVTQVSPQGDAHAIVTAWLQRTLSLQLGLRYYVRTQLPFAASRDSMPEPDIVVIPDDGRRRHPSAALLIVEVSDSSLAIDRVIKAAIYAKARVPEYWIADLEGGVVEVRTVPTAKGYTRTRTMLPGDILRPLRMRRVRIAVSGIPF